MFAQFTAKMSDVFSETQYSVDAWRCSSNGINWI